MNDKPKGTPIPVTATPSESHILAFNDETEVDNPPTMSQYIVQVNMRTNISNWTTHPHTPAATNQDSPAGL